MTWVPIPNAVRKLREAAKLEQRELAKKSGITERAIRLLESKRAPKTMYAATVEALAATLNCAPEDLATWVPRKRGYDVDDEIQSVIALPPASTLARHAQREQELGRDNETLTMTSGRYALLGPTLLKRCHAACATVEDELFAVSGMLKDYESLPARAAAVLERDSLALSVARCARPSRIRAREERAAQQYLAYWEQRSDEPARRRPAAGAAVGQRK